MNVLIITGGDSSERRISLMSSKQVRDALAKKGYKVKIFDFRKDLNELQEVAKNFDVIFPVLHGEEGEGGELHKKLQSFSKRLV